MSEPWYQYAINEIDRSGKQLRENEKGILASIKDRLKIGMSLSARQEAALVGIHKRATEIGPIRYRR